MNKSTDTSEKGLEAFIEASLLNQSKYIPRNYQNYDRELCLDVELLFQFIEKTQSESLEKLKKTHGDLYKKKFCKRLFDQIKSKGVIHVLRKGVNDNDIKVTLLYDKPVSIYNIKDLENYRSNIFSVVRQLHYSTSEAQNALDLVTFINGIPLITFELKNELTKQDVNDAVKQYKYSRNPNEELFRLGRCMVHFAIDTEAVYMTTHLKGKDTDFLPFNKGFNNGAGNPPNPAGIKTAYLWEEILSKESLTEIIENYVQLVEEKDDKGTVEKKLIFPRYHQLDVVRKLLAHAKKNEVGNKYLIEHSAGSGKSNSISWLAHQLIGLYDLTNSKPVFDSVVVVTDRRVLDQQIRNTIKQFQQVKGVVEAITEGSKQLKLALEEGKKIIITTIQKFPYIVNEIGDLPATNFAIIIDEAHSSQSGNTAGMMNVTLSKDSEIQKETDKEDEDEEEWTDEDEIIRIIKARKFLPNASYFAFTATPKNKTLELFGVKRPDGKFEPFHLYSMKQAIDEGFILDVLQNYTTCQTYYSLLKKIEDDPRYDVNKAQKKMRAYVEAHEYAIEEKTKKIVDHFFKSVIRKNKINGMAKAMVVTSSRKNAVRYKIAFDNYLKEIKSPYKAIVAFSGEVPLDGDKFTEFGMNHFSSSSIPEEFKKSESRFLIVANKFQTGFDQPLLHTMYVDKKLGGVHAVQTLSRLNRTFRPYKTDTFVLDFANKAEDIQKSFNPYYEGTLLSEGTDPNKLFDLQDSLDNFQVYNKENVQEFSDKIIHNVPVDQLHAILDLAAANYKELPEEQQVDFKVKVKSYVRLYTFLSQIVPFVNPYLERLYLFLKHLYNKLGSNEEEDLAKGILENIDMASYKIQLEGTQKISLVAEGELKPVPIEMRGGTSEPEVDLLSNIIKTFNERYGTEFGNEDRVKRTFIGVADEVEKDDEFIKATKNSDVQNAKITFDKVLQEKFQDVHITNFDLYKKFTDDPEFRAFISAKLFEMVWENMTMDMRR